MRSRKFESIEAAIQYLEARGELKFFGRIGYNAEICLYSYIYKGIDYTLYIYLDGKVEIRE